MSLRQGSNARVDGHLPEEEAVTPFGNYLLLHAFARGGMGEVYLARVASAASDRYCVLKKLRPDLTRDSEYVRRFIDEARIVVQLHHPNICHVFDVGRVASEYYLAMEYVSGLDARALHDRARSRQEPVPVPVALHVVAEVLDALDYAHARTHPVTGEPLHLIHRDVSPQNVMVSYDGDVKLIDFGLASSRLKVEKTQPNVVMGKMAYMAPEQARGEGIDATVDLFAAAVLAYELCTGERFYEGMAAQEIWAVAGRGDFKPPRWGSLDGELTRILGRALHPVVKKRYPTGREFRDALLQYLSRRHPGPGREALRAWLAEAFASERERELDALRGYRALEHQIIQEALESSRSLSVSLAHSEFFDRLLASTAEPSSSSSVEQTHFGASGGASWGPSTELEHPSEPGADPDTEADEHTALVSPSRSASGGRPRLALHPSRAGAPAPGGERTQVLPRASGSEMRARAGSASERRASSFLPGLLVGSIAVALIVGILFPERLPRSSAEGPPPVEDGAVRVTPVPAHAVESGEPAQGAVEEVGADDRVTSTGASRARARVGTEREDAGQVESRTSRNRPRKAARRGRRAAGSDAADGTASPVVANNPVANNPSAPPAPAALVESPAPAAAIAPRAEASAPRVEKAPPPAWAALSREERLGLLRSCEHPCREQVTAAYVTLKVKERTPSAARRQAAQDAFDAQWMACYKRCR